MRRTHAQAGFSLLELAIVLTVVGVMMVSGLQIAVGWMAQEHVTTTDERLQAIEDALVLYAARNKRLPCPADAQAGFLSASDGAEQDGGDGDPTICAVGLRYSAVPWRVLGLSQGLALDAWNRRITYRVFDGATGVTRPNGVDMTACAASATDEGGSSANCGTGVSPNEFLRGKGLTVSDGTNTILNPAQPSSGGGAAFVLISHGLQGWGGHTRTGATMTAPGPAFTLELENLDYTSDNIFIEAAYSENQSAPTSFFDDRVRAPTIHAIASESQLGPN